MAIDIHVQDEQVAVEIAQGEINTGKPPVLQEISVTKDGTYTPDYGVDGFSKVEVLVLPTDVLGSLEEGYTVMFYDGNKKGLASYSIKQGHAINPPVYDCKAWQTADGTVATFPYTPTEDTIFYILKQTYEDQLYEFYGLDPVIYPYLIITANTGNIMIRFGKSLGYNLGHYLLFNEVYHAESYLGSTTGVTITDFSDIGSVVSAAMTLMPTLSYKSTYGINTGTGWYHYQNFESALTEEYVAMKYYLDE